MSLFTTRPFGRDPFAELRRLHSELDGLFWEGDRRAGPSIFPAVNLWVGDEGVAVTAEIPGVDPSDIELSVEGDELSISGERKAPEGETVNWHRRERAFGKFSRTVQLPFRVDPDEVEARFRDGLLEVTLRRPAADRPRKIAVKAN